MTKIIKHIGQEAGHRLTARDDFKIRVARHYAERFLSEERDCITATASLAKFLVADILTAYADARVVAIKAGKSVPDDIPSRTLPDEWCDVERAAMAVFGKAA